MLPSNNHVFEMAADSLLDAADPDVPELESWMRAKPLEEQGLWRPQTDDLVDELPTMWTTDVDTLPTTAQMGAIWLFEPLNAFDTPLATTSGVSKVSRTFCSRLMIIINPCSHHLPLISATYS